MRYDERPTDATPIDTGDLPATPVRDRNIPARAWTAAPARLLALGGDLPGAPEAEYKRRIGPWLLWRAGPASGAEARYWVCHGSDHSLQFELDLHADGSAEGVGPSGARH
ncbi:MAG: hypothetical protein ISP34_00625, partial [Ilumatobacteraceae bacterium]|nr:hypothetical protein [Ilumatobacteraceae bacterium]